MLSRVTRRRRERPALQRRETENAEITRRRRLHGRRWLCRLGVASEFATHYGAEQEIVKIGFSSIQTEQRCNLGPVANLVKQNVGHNLLRGCGEQAVHELELDGRIPRLGGKRYDEIP